MKDVLVIQSYRDYAVDEWVQVCSQSVRDWAALQGYQYCFQGDEIFDFLPKWYTQKLVDRTPIWADLARLLWIQQLLNQGSAPLVIWMDIDVLVFSPRQLQIEPVSTCVFGYEYWLQRDRETKVGYRVRKNVHNALCAFRKGCPILPFLIEVVQRMIKKVDAQFIAPQFVGPKLLTSLHNIVGFELERSVGVVSPDLATALVEEDRITIEYYLRHIDSPVLAANLCASLAEGKNMLALIEVLLKCEDGLG